MGSSNASRNDHGGFASAARHAKRAFDEGEDDLFALSLDDVMSDRPWTADEHMSAEPIRQAIPPRRHRLSPRRSILRPNRALQISTTLRPVSLPSIPG